MNADTQQKNSERLKLADLLFKKECRFVTSVADLAKLPPSRLPEIAFAGRSNVGKSSVINALTNRRALAISSSTPGRTRLLNYFNLADKVLMVDMPGYGYAKASKADVEKWNLLVCEYLKNRPNLKRVFILVDARHGLKDSDREMMDLLGSCAMTFQIVLTKCDKIKDNEKAELMASISGELGKRAAAYGSVVATSSVEKSGLEDLRAAIYDLTLL